MNTIKKHKWSITIIFVLLISMFLLWKIQYPFLHKIVFFSFVIVILPFIYLVIIKIKSAKPNILGLPIKDFMTIWIAFWGLFGVFLGIIQVQRQISNQDKQIHIQQNQFEKQQCDARFSSGVELLGNPNESARIGGAYSLYFLASENKEYLNPVCEILCAHIRNITSDKDYQEKYQEKFSNEILSIIGLLFKDKNDSLIFNDCVKDFTGAYLHGASFLNAKLNNVCFKGASLYNVEFIQGTLNYVDFSNATLNNVYFSFDTLSNIRFFGTKLENVRFMGTLNDIMFFESELNDVDFPCSILSKIYFTGVELNNVNFLSKLSDCSFSFSKLRNVNFDGAELSGGDFMGAELSNVRFNEAKLSNVKFCDTEELISNSDITTLLSDIDFSDAKLEEIDFKNTVLENYDYEEITREGRSLELTKPKAKN